MIRNEQRSLALPSPFLSCGLSSDPLSKDPQLLDPVFLDFSDDRAAQKARYGGEFFPSSFAADAVGRTFLEFFQLERYSGERKGIVLVELAGDPTIQSEVTT